jgi:hypothetical protein
MSRKDVERNYCTILNCYDEETIKRGQRFFAQGSIGREPFFAHKKI